MLFVFMFCVPAQHTELCCAVGRFYYIGTLQDLQALPRHFSRALCKVGGEGADRENDGKITSVSGQAWD